MPCDVCGLLISRRAVECLSDVVKLSYCSLTRSRNLALTQKSQRQYPTPWPPKSPFSQGTILGTDLETDLETDNMPAVSQESQEDRKSPGERQSRPANGDQSESSPGKNRHSEEQSSHSSSRQKSESRAVAMLPRAGSSVSHERLVSLTTLDPEAQPSYQAAAGTNKPIPVPHVLMMSCGIPFPVVFGHVDRCARIALLYDNQDRVPAGRITLKESANDLLSTYVRSRYPSIKRLLLELHFDDMLLQGGQMRAEHLRADHLRTALRSLLPLVHDCELHIVIHPNPSMLDGSGTAESTEQELYNLALVNLTELAWEYNRMYVRLRTDRHGTWGRGEDFWFLWFSTVKPDRRDTEFRPGM